jgi:hypothetical protein
LDLFAINKVDSNWKNGKRVIAFLSTTCPHCRDMAFKLHILKKQHPEFKILFVYGGTPETKKKFLLKSKSDDVPHIDLPINDLVKISGPVFPVVLGTDNGMVRKKWNIITVSEDELNNFFK